MQAHVRDCAIGCDGMLDGFFTLIFHQDDMRCRYLDRLFRDLEPAVQAAIRFLG